MENTISQTHKQKRNILSRKTDLIGTSDRLSRKKDTRNRSDKKISDKKASPIKRVKVKEVW